MLEYIELNIWLFWLAAAIGLVGVEIFTGTFYLFMISFGLLAGSIAAYFGAPLTFQIGTAATVGALATYVLRRTKLSGQHKAKPNLEVDTGQVIQIEEWEGNADSGYIARVKYRGAMWDVDLEHGLDAKPGAHVIQGMKGSHLQVRHASQTDS